MVDYCAMCYRYVRRSARGTIQRQQRDDACPAPAATTHLDLFTITYHTYIVRLEKLRKNEIPRHNKRRAAVRQQQNEKKN